MIKIKTILILLALILPSQTFAGYYVLNSIEADEYKTKMGFYLQGEYRRIDYYFEGEKSFSTISSPDFEKALLLDHKAKTYMESDLMTNFAETMAKKGAKAAMDGLVDDTMGNSLEGQVFKSIFKGAKNKKKKKKEKKKKKMPKLSFKPEYVEIKPTSRTKEILGRKTQEIEVYYNGKLFQNVWVTKDYPKGLVEAEISMLEDEKLFSPEYMTDIVAYQKHTQPLIDKYGLGLMVISEYKGKAKKLYNSRLTKKGKKPKKSKMEVKKIKSGKIPAKYFVPPKDYEEIKLPKEDE